MGLLKSIGKVFKSVTKPIKKVIKSPVGIAALVGLGLRLMLSMVQHEVGQVQLVEYLEKDPTWLG